MNKKIISLILLLGATSALFGADIQTKENNINELRAQITIQMESLHDDDSKHACESLLEQDLKFVLKASDFVEIEDLLNNTPDDITHLKLDKRIRRLENLLDFLTNNGPELMPPS